jgi:hypothetical protein
VSDVPAPQPGDHLRRILQRLRAKRGSAEPSAYELAIEKGAHGELEFGNALNEAAKIRGGCCVLHSLVLKGKRADIDHVVIGPAGVTAIDSKTWSRRVWAGRVGLGRGRRAYPKEIDGVSRQINRVHSRLAKAGYDNVPVEGLICLVNRNDGIPAAGLTEIRGIKVGHPDAVMHHALRDGRFDTPTVDIVARILEEEFAVNGGTQQPTERPRPRPARRRTRTRFPTRFALIVVGIALVVGGLAALINGLGSSAEKLSRADLLAGGSSYRRIAIKRAHGRVRGPKIRASPTEFLLVYRHGKRCRIVVEVSRAAGKPTRVHSSGCRRS